MKKVVHTPEGVRDIYGNECQRKHFLQDKNTYIRLYAREAKRKSTPHMRYFNDKIVLLRGKIILKIRNLYHPTGTNHSY